MPGGKASEKKNLYSFDSGPEKCILLRICVCLDTGRYGSMVSLCGGVECLAHAQRWGSQSPLFKLLLMSPGLREVLELIKFAWKPKS